MDFEKITTCPICNGDRLPDFITAKDYTTSLEHFTIKKCQSCDLGITTPRPTKETISKYYQSDKYISHTGGQKTISDSLYRFARNHMHNWKRNVIEQLQRSGSILDYGCGTGEFLQYMKYKGWDIYGVEPAAEARAKAISNTQAEIVNTIDDLPSTQVDIITLWHVAEHLHDLNAILQLLKSRLKPGGSFLIAVPNYQSPDSKNYKSHWAGYDVPRHIWHFSPSSMNQLLTKNGMTLVTKKPMVLDALYISYLSETYQYPKQANIISLIKGIIHGIRSNWKARVETNHSSILYIAKA